MMTVGLLFSFLLAVGADAPARPPNVVMIIGDDQGWMDFGFMGSKVVSTPNIDRLASQSAVYPNGYVPTSLCRASLATLLTGLYPHQHKICVNDPPDGVDRSVMDHFIQDVPTVPRLLGKAGYASFQTGKLWEGHFRHARFTDGMTTKGRHGDEGLAIGRQTMKPIYDFISSHKQEPFFVWYAPMLPHEPHNPPQRLLEKYVTADRNPKLAKYYAMCEWFDETCGALLDFLHEEGLEDNTLIVFVIDNGWIQETGTTRTTRGWFAPKSKLSPYDGGLRTPILLRWPGHIDHAVHDDLVSTIDLAPTMLEACGVAPPKDLPGISLLASAERGVLLPRQTVFGEIFEHTSVDLNQPARNLLYRWIRDGKWKLIAPVSTAEKPELYDLSADPTEENNLAQTHPALVQTLTGKLDAWWTPR